MFRTLKILVALALGACAAAAFADPPGRVGRVNYAAGAVSFAPAEAPDQWTQAPLNRPLTAGDRLWADANGRAELHVGSTALRMGAQTSVDILNLDDHALQLRLAQGSVNMRVRELDANDTIEIATPGGAVLIRQPGSYRVSTDPLSGATRLVVNFGQAEVVTPSQTFTVPSSQAASFAVGASPTFEIAGYASADELDRWSADRDRREDRVASTRYVSPQMTGYEDLDDYGSWRTLPEYGAVWVPTRVASGWAPYRHGHWVWISPWGWTWVDDAPWGFAPFHYGRWVWHDGYWAWAPGRITPRPVYAPALVAFVGGPGFSVTVSRGPSVGWFPLGWREPYFPSHRASPTYVRNVNVTHVTNVTNVTNIYNNSTNASSVSYVNRRNPQAVTVVPQQAFVSARPIAQASMSIAPSQLATAEVVHARAPAEPVRASFAREQSGQRPPATVAAREVVAVTAPAKAAVQASVAPQDVAGPSTPRRSEHEPRVRVIARERGEPRADKAALQPGTPAQQAPVAPPPAVSASTAARAVQRPAEGTAAVPRPPQVVSVQPKSTPPNVSVQAQEEAAAKARTERREQHRAAPSENAQKPSATEAPRPAAERERREPRREPQVSAGVSRDQRARERPEQAVTQRPPQAAPAPRAEAPRAQAARAEPPRGQAEQPDAKKAQAQSQKRDGRPHPERTPQPLREAPKAASAPPS